MCEFHESTCNGFGDIWWTDNPIYFSSIDSYVVKQTGQMRTRHIPGGMYDDGRDVACWDGNRWDKLFLYLPGMHW